MQKNFFEKFSELCKELDFIFEPIVAQLMPIEKMFSIVDKNITILKKKLISIFLI